MNYKKFQDEAEKLGYRKTTIEDHGSFIVVDAPGKAAFCFKNGMLNYCITLERIKIMGFEKALKKMKESMEKIRKEVQLND